MNNRTMEYGWRQNKDYVGGANKPVNPEALY